MTRRLSGWLHAYGMIDNDKLDTYITVTATNARVRTASDNARKVFFRVKNLSLLTARNNIGNALMSIQRRRWPALSVCTILSRFILLTITRERHPSQAN